MATSKNKPDDIVKMFRAHLKDLEQQKKEIQREIDRTLKALKLWVPVNPSRIPTTVEGEGNGNRIRIHQGPVRRDSHTVLFRAVKAYYAEGHVFKFQDAVRLGVEAGLRGGQAHGAVQTCMEMGMFTRVKKGHYYWGKEKTENNGTES